MSPKQRFPVMLEAHQLAALRRIDQQHGIRVSEQIRRAIDHWLLAFTPRAEVTGGAWPDAIPPGSRRERKEDRAILRRARLKVAKSRKRKS
jgi:hypothetical protein